MRLVRWARTLQRSALPAARRSGGPARRSTAPAPHPPYPACRRLAAAGRLTFCWRLQTAYVGVDARLSDRWLAGVAVARSRGDGDWTFGSSTGRLTTNLTSVQPYLRWSDGGTTIWATAGGGTGSAENERLLYGLQEQSDLGLRLGLVEVRRQLATVGHGVELQLRGDASWARLTTAAGDELIDALEVEVQQLRVGIDVSRPVRTAGGTLVEPFGEVHARHDGGSGQTGAGLEVAGGLRVARGVFRVEGMGRLLARDATNGRSMRASTTACSSRPAAW